MKELFEKVYIKTEDDLPKEAGKYIVQEKDYDTPMYLRFIDVFDYKSFCDNVDWYLHPVTEPLYEKEFI